MVVLENNSLFTLAIIVVACFYSVGSGRVRSKSAHRWKENGKYSCNIYIYIKMIKIVPYEPINCKLTKKLVLLYRVVERLVVAALPSS